MAGKNDTILRSVSVPGPTVLVSGKLSGNALPMATAIAVSYSDAGEGDTSEVRLEGALESRVLTVNVREKREFRRYLI